MSPKNLVTSEIASGTINGVNKTFTVSKLISNINEVLFEGSAYAQYSFSGNTIVLDDAPSSGQILVTYSYESNYDYLDNSGWIVGEIASGVIDGNNKIYSLFYPISIIDEVRVDGAPVVGYTIVGNSILLASAPTTGNVEVDYFRKDLILVDYSRDIYFTKKEVRDKVYDDIGQDDTSVQYPKSLVDLAVADGVTELITQVVDKSRYIPFYILNKEIISISSIENSNSLLQVNGEYLIPPKGRLMNYLNGYLFDYSQISSTGVMSVDYNDFRMRTDGSYIVGYRLPRNIKRVVSVTSENGYILQDAGSIPSFVFGNGGYVINNGYIYINSYGKILIEVEVDEYIFGDDNSFVFIDKEDIGVVVYYALRQLYQSRESDKLNAASQIYLDKLKSYKRRMRKKRSNNSMNLMRTSNGLRP